MTVPSGEGRAGTGRGGSGPGGALLVANCSGFYGDRLAAAREMVEGGPIDVLTGDWLAELTMVVLHKTRDRGGYAHTFLRQLEEVLPACVERGVRVVANAGGLDPPACAAAVRELAARQGVAVRVASVAGDDLVPRLDALRAGGERFANLDTGEDLPRGATVVTANAYLGGAPVAAALAAGADVVVTGRVTDASLVVGPAIWAHGWGPLDLDRLAGAVVAGHVVECGAQCCGGNYAFFEEIPGLEHVGFPLVEVAADGASVVTKHPGTGGAVTVGTVTAQLLYEIGGPRYLSPDAVARFDSVVLAQEGPDRVRISGVRGEPPPDRLKVAANLAGGWRNAVTFVLTGAQVEAKARAAEAAVLDALPGGAEAFDEWSAELSGDRSGAGVAYLRLAVRGGDPAAVGRAFSSAAVGTSLATYPGAFTTAAPSGAQEVARFWPTTVAADRVVPEVVVDGEPFDARPAWWEGGRAGGGATGSAADAAVPAVPHDAAVPAVPVATPPAGATPVVGGASAGTDDGDLRTVPLGVLVGARSGDKGGDANVGLWAEDPHTFAWLVTAFDVDAFRRLLPEVGHLPVARHVLANLLAVNFVVHGLLGWGVASNLRLDPQAKGLAELVRSRPVRAPARLLDGGPVARRTAGWNRAMRDEVH